MRIYRTTLLIAAALSVATVVRADPRIYGTVLGHDGKPMPGAAVRVLWPTRITVASTDVDASGRFSLTTKQTGLMLLQFAGVNHAPYTTLALLDQTSNIAVSVRLPTVDLDPNPQEVMVNAIPGKDFFAPKPMAKQPDGTFVAEFTVPDASEPFAYRIDGIKSGGGPVSGTQAEGYRVMWFPPGGIFYSTVKPVGGRVKIVFDPKQFESTSTSARIDFASARRNSLDRIYQSMADRERDRSRQEDAAKKAYATTGGKDRDFQFRPAAATRKQVADVVGQLESASDATVRQLLALTYLDLTVPGGPFDPARIDRALTWLTPRSSFWSLRPSLAQYAVHASAHKEAHKDYALQTVDAISDRFAKARALADIAAAAYGTADDAVLEQALRRLGTDFGDLSPAQQAIGRYGDTKLAKGQLLPSFAFPAMNRPGMVYTKSLASETKLLLIDFWATWCPPCVAEMPSLHKAYAGFHAKGFEILSCSLDEEARAVESFRQQKFPMPWLHAQGGSMDDEMYRLFGLFGIPAAILVDSNGAVIATNEDIRGDRLEKMLVALLK